MSSQTVLEAPTARTEYDADKEAARDIQHSLVPAGNLKIPHTEVAYRFSAYAEVGGDFLDFFCLPDGMVGIYIGDVVGKGLSPAMYGALVMGASRGINKTGEDTAAVLALLNKRLLARPVRGLLRHAVRAFQSRYSQAYIFKCRLAVSRARLARQIFDAGRRRRAVRGVSGNDIREAFGPARARRLGTVCHRRIARIAERTRRGFRVGSDGRTLEWLRRQIGRRIARIPFRGRQIFLGPLRTARRHHRRRAQGAAGNREQRASGLPPRVCRDNFETIAELPVCATISL
jgi:hypothetical protein